MNRVMQCLSCKNKESNERCTYTSIRGYLYCGRHLRAKRPHPWIEANPSVLRGLQKFQALWRRFEVRNRLALAGPGVLCRKECHNQEDIVTGEERVHPFEYFAVREGDKVWWFEQKSILQWAHKNVEITNPYTRTKFSKEDSRRLRHIYTYRVRHLMPVWHIPFASTTPADEKQELRWRRIVQILQEHDGFEDTHINHFLSLGFAQLYLFSNLLAEDMYDWVYRNSTPMRHIKDSRRYRVWTWLNEFCKQMPLYTSTIKASTELAGILSAVLNEFKDCSDLVFLVVSAHFKSMLVYPVL